MKRFWLSFLIVFVLSFSILGWIGGRIYQEASPLPIRVLSSDGSIVVDTDDISRGQNVWQSMGGMEVGSIWGHGSYLAPDWTADWLHREALFILNEWAQNEFHSSYESLSLENKSKLQGRLQEQLRANTYDEEKKTVVISPVRAKAFQMNLNHFSNVFSKGSVDYAIPEKSVSDPKRLKELAAFFFWTSWTAVTNRPGQEISYTHNWPHEPLVANIPSGETIVWTGVSIIMLLAGISAMIWWYAAKTEKLPQCVVPSVDPLINWKCTPSQKSVLKYFWIVAALIILQILLGIVTAHYGVEGDGFFGIPLAKWLPYSVARTWHVQIGLFWIATAWLAAGLFIGPLVSGVEPKGQRLGVNVLFTALLVVVIGSLAGEWFSIQNKLSDGVSFYFGHQGYEYLDLGRFWQIALLLGLMLWFFLVQRAIRPALKAASDQKHLLYLFLVSAGAIALFYGAGLFWGQHTHLSIVEYWRWWVVHLWVEGFFEVFATTVIAFFFARLKLVNSLFAAQAALLSATIYLSGGIIGTCHHLYFSGTPTVALAWGSVFSALEVVPLVLIAYAAIDDLRRVKANSWVQRYKWPIYFFVAVAFWNMVGAGLFGFMINPPIALYYMQGLNTTPLHGHAALFGVYGMLGMGLMLVCLRFIKPLDCWNDRMISFSFWSVNIGLLLMCIGSLLPVGLMQTLASVNVGYWYARSHEFLGTPLMQTFRWLRVPGDIVFSLGAVAFGVFVYSLKGAKKSAD